ncbi:Do family serine endopeptidase [Ideonella sp. A 288]|uniref:Do family serine endopeptidase n=1 Tax=Ideonella sp. A 288 TaxID=1962181 RepID=UPI000B4A6E89|nr:Do family serine endopeptidase [Ideonella sp. A 288]
MKKPVVSSLGWFLLGGSLAAVTGVAAIDLPWRQSPQPTVATAPVAAAAATVAAPVAPIATLGGAPNYRAIVQQSGPAVVGVRVEGMRQAVSDDESADDPAQRFFRSLPGFRGAQPDRQPFRGQGSGFIVTADGIVLTNAHVVRDAKEVTVRLADRREFAAKVLGSDPATDIAVLRIEAKGLPTVRLGDARSLMVGDPVLAIGAPYGLEQTATAGIVSAKGRSLPGEAIVPFIQTDAAVNPGNSGGPLFDGEGRVVGINSQIYSRTGGFQGVSFAIPIDLALKVRDQIVSSGRAQHARLGVQVQDLNQALAESFGLPRPDGALVAAVDPDSPAAKAGLKSGDVILQIDGEPTVQAGALSARIGLAKPGDKVTLKVWRGKAEQELAVTLGAARPETQASAEAADAAEGGGRLGLALRPLSPIERQQARVEHGVLVQGVQGAAQRAGLQRGDVVMAINGQPVDGIEDLQRVLSGKPKQVALLVWRGGERMFVPVPLA